MTTGTKASFTKALRKASGLGGMTLVRRELGNGLYVVQGSREYLVRVVDGEYSCDCAAGLASIACYHAAAVFLLIIARRAMPEAQPTTHTAPWTEGSAPGSAEIFAGMRG